MGFHPRRFGSPKNAITPEQVIRHRSQRRGGKGGQILSHLSSYPCFLFHILIKGILQSRRKTVFKNVIPQECMVLNGG
jgi:hypothetical protein